MSFQWLEMRIDLNHTAFGNMFTRANLEGLPQHSQLCLPKGFLPAHEKISLSKATHPPFTLPQILSSFLQFKAADTEMTHPQEALANWLNMRP